MDHPLRVDEFSPSEMPPRPATEPAAPELSFSAAAAATLPPLPSLAADEVLFLRPSDRRELCGILGDEAIRRRGLPAFG